MKRQSFATWIGERLTRASALAIPALAVAMGGSAVSCAGTGHTHSRSVSGADSGGGTEGVSNPEAGSVELVLDDSGGQALISRDGSVAVPANFVATELGGYALGPPITAGGTDAGV